ncbi:glycoside hydrolase family 3 C-terminal domain-containing protein [Streptomyces sp. NPDC058457]|uniref:glycoside hydrolase family 3 C-terminal domain-containing protein n=1 Tax=Streptomyces sp. NPDC058457 TaxID=3346507 RepID=UPI003659B640
MGATAAAAGVAAVPSAAVAATGPTPTPRRAQHRSMVLLQNLDGILPLKITSGSPTKVYGYGLSAAALTAYGLTPVADPAEADLAVLLLQTPRSGEHLADLDYKDTNADYQAVRAVQAAGIPSIAAVQLDRPAILTNIRDKVTGLVAHFGLSEEALLDVLTGRACPEGRLPFDLPATPASVLAQQPDLPYDLEHPLYRHGFGLCYPSHRSSAKGGAHVP